MFEDNFVEKMMELGIGMTMMRQIPSMMEGSLLQSPVPNTSEVAPPLEQTLVSDTYIAVKGQQAGPLTESELKLLVEKQLLTPETLVWKPKMAQWAPAKTVPSVNKLFLMYGLD